MFYRIFNYSIPIIAGLLILLLAIIGYKNAKLAGTERKNIRYMILGIGMILASIFLVLLE